MHKIAITENTYHFLKNNFIFLTLEKMEYLKCKENDTEYALFFELDADNFNDIYELIMLIYKENPNENNRWIFKNKEYLLSDEEPIRFFLSKFENIDNYPLNGYILSNIIKYRKIHCIQELRMLAYQPFSGILSFNELDMLRIIGNKLDANTSDYIKIEYKDTCIKNRYIASKLEIVEGKIDFENCIFDCDIIINGAKDVTFSQCIITGKIICFGISHAYFNSTNVKHLMIYNSSLNILSMDYCKVYRFVIHSCSINKLRLYSNEFIEPYMANLDIQDAKYKIDMSQFTTKNINKRMIERINKDKPIKIKDENNFYLTFMFGKTVASITPNDISLDMVDIILSYGDLDKKHYLYTNMKYQKALYSNTKWRRLFVFLTGAFYIPNRWIVYLILNIVIFTVLYTFFPNIQFGNILTNKMEKLNLWTALYYSVFQIIGSNPTIFTPIGISQICTTMQSVLNTVFIANLFASIIKRYIRDE